MSESKVINFPVDSERARLELLDTDTRDYSELEWSPSGIMIELPVRVILVWPRTRYSEPEITIISIQ